MPVVVQFLQDCMDLFAMGVEVPYRAGVRTQLNVAEAIGGFRERHVSRKVLERPAVRPASARNDVAGL